MRAARGHPWDVSVSEAIAIQQELRHWVVTANTLGEVRSVAGVDVSAKGGVARAAVVVLSYPGLEPLEASIATRRLEFPYVPGLLSFREAPAILEALHKLHLWPDLIILDGQGMAHPRRLGIATHVGVLLDHPTIGCAKSYLCGVYQEPGPEKGSYSHLYDNDEIIGAVLRTRDRTNPVFVSIGHKVDLESAISFVLGCCTHYRLPETTRWAHKVAGGAVLPQHDYRKQGRLF